MGTPHRFLAIGILVSLALIWGSSFILMDRGLVAFSPLQVAGLRMTIAGLTLLPFARQALRRVDRKAWPWIVLVGIVGNALPAFLFPLAETVITPATAGILNTLSPVFALLLGVLLFGFRFSRLKVTGVMISFVGALVLVLSGAKEINLSTHLQYSGLVVLATLGYGLSVNIIKKRLQDVFALDISTLALLAMALPYGLYLAFSDVGTILQVHPYAWASLGFIAVLGAIGTAFALILFNRLVQLTDPMVSASVTYLIPVVALGWDLLAGNPVYGGQVLGMVVILSGVWLVNKR
jgi:drug/metabolite transporter (DMT)-like permease